MSCLFKFVFFFLIQENKMIGLKSCVLVLRIFVHQNLKIIVVILKSINWKLSLKLPIIFHLPNPIAYVLFAWSHLAIAICSGQVFYALVWKLYMGTFSFFIKKKKLEKEFQFPFTPWHMGELYSPLRFNFNCNRLYLIRHILIDFTIVNVVDRWFFYFMERNNW